MTILDSVSYQFRARSTLAPVCNMNAEPTRQCGLSVKMAGYLVGGIDSALTVFLLVYTVLNLINGDTWLQAAISSSSFAFALTIVVLFFVGLQRNDSFFIVPMLALQCVIIIWCFIWIFAGMTNIVSGHLWATESLGGPKSNNDPRVTDIHSANYIDSEQDNPETVRAIKIGQLSIGISMVGVFFSMWAFVMIKGLYEWMLKANVDFKQKEDKLSFERVPYHSRLDPIAV
uniref:MARVEL domain-containing protein n=1 Tax=Steinernema glaseri TaxID=37863 RepID=A0A1I7YRR0_9BILA